MEENDDHDASAHQLSEVEVKYALKPLDDAREFKDQVQATQIQTQNQLQPHDDPSSFELSPTSISNPTPQEYKILTCVPETEKHTSLYSKPPILKRPSHDGYNWRKYGQKPVKSPQGSRSYYRCTYSECYAKKIECSDQTNKLVEIVYKSQHNHDPTRKISFSPALSKTPTNEPNEPIEPIEPNDLVSSTTCSKETKEQRTDGSHKNSEINKIEAKTREKRRESDGSETQIKYEKKPKVVVHASGDVGISEDGYRWRKYGQKIVKGNSHPRNYYRCTSAGCPVRKHIESAKDNVNGVIITYKGIHDHDMPVPKKRQGIPSARLIAASAEASMSQTSLTKWSVDKEGGLTSERLELGNDKDIRSTKTLLSIGFEIKNC